MIVPRYYDIFNAVFLIFGLLYECRLWTTENWGK